MQIRSRTRTRRGGRALGLLAALIALAAAPALAGGPEPGPGSAPPPAGPLDPPSPLWSPAVPPAVIAGSTGVPLAQGAAEGEAPAESVLPEIARRLSFGGQIRSRYEIRRPTSYGPGWMGKTDDLILLRTRVHVKAEVSEVIDAFVQIQDSRVWGDEASVVSDEEGLDLHQAWVEVHELFSEHLALKVGRQELKYGDQRLVSPLDWSNVGRAWDAIKIRGSAGDHFWIDGFASVIRQGADANDDRNFDGVYASITTAAPTIIDVYVFHRNFADRAFLGEDGKKMKDLRDYTTGARFETKAGPFRGTAEGVYQFGNRGDDVTNAFGIAVQGSVTLDDVVWVPTFLLEYTYGSGDSNPTDEDNETFDPLFPFGHFYQGFLDIFAWRNGEDLKAAVAVKPHEIWWVELAAHYLRLVERKDAWYNAGGGVIRRDPTGRSGREIGVEIDLHAKVKVHEGVLIWFGYSHLFPGEYVRRTGRDRDMDWIFLIFQVGF